MITDLRPYQVLALSHLQRCVAADVSRMYIELPTGTGKSTIAAAFIEQRQAQGRILALVHRQDLALQLARTIRLEELEVGLLMEGKRTLDTRIVVATVQSLTLNATRELIAAHPEPIRTILIDEAHHAVPGSLYERILTDIEQAISPQSVVVVGMTATPYRSDDQSMLTVLPVCAFARSIPEMVQAGWLAPLVWKPVRVDLDLETIGTTLRSGERDYVEATLARHLLSESITRQIVAHTLPLIGQRPTLVFASSVSHAKQLAEAFRTQGAEAVAIFGQIGRRQRDELFANWRSGVIQIVCNCSLLTEGMDFPSIGALVIVRPTLSPSLYMQMLGRGMRLADGKIDCLVIDLIGNQPDPRRQVILPYVVGIQEDQEDERSKKELTGRKKIDPILRRILGGQGETGLVLLDPLGRSHYRWTSYSKGYFARINAYVTTFLYCDPHQSGLYRSYLCTLLPSDNQLECQCIGPQYLPLRRQVALVQDATQEVFQEYFAGKEAGWLEEPATEKQLGMLRRYDKRLPEYAHRAGWTKRQASEAITYYQLRPVLLNPPEPEK